MVSTYVRDLFDNKNQKRDLMYKVSVKTSAADTRAET